MEEVAKVLSGERRWAVGSLDCLEFLAEFFVLSFCKPGGVVCDPFSGSGTTGTMALHWGRRFVGCDVRQSQVDLSTKRIRETPNMFTAAGVGPMPTPAAVEQNVFENTVETAG